MARNLRGFKNLEGFIPEIFLNIYILALSEFKRFSKMNTENR
ncbi:hypothetical protein BGP_6510 [Beggiatoa sp. PS]|nr:hypothetical protein BGP_6510 [Beggiatoa sp. PS]